MAAHGGAWVSQRWLNGTPTQRRLRWKPRRCGAERETKRLGQSHGGAARGQGHVGLVLCSPAARLRRAAPGRQRGRRGHAAPSPCCGQRRSRPAAAATGGRE
eukprot:7383334-Prymnesium_polylepis.2